MSYLRRFLSLGELIMFSFRFSSRNVQYYILLYIIFIRHACFRQLTSSVIEFPFKGFRCVYYKMYKGNLLSQRAIENAWPINPSAKRTLRINAKIKTRTEKGCWHNNDIINVDGGFRGVVFFYFRLPIDVGKRKFDVSR